MGKSWNDLVLGGVRRLTPNGPEAINLVINELQKVRYSRVRGGRAACQCPYHVSDTGFSRTLNFNLNPNRINSVGFQVPVGYFYCWSCGRSGPWNEYAEYVGLEKLVETDNPDVSKNLMQIQWEDEYVEPDPSMIFDVEDDWVRDDGVIKLKTLRKFGAKIWMKVVNDNGDYISRRKMLLPALQNGENVGHVEVRLESEDIDPDPKYLNSPGVWSSQYWLGFDAVSEMFDTNYCCLVEGPADWLMMVQNRIPALPLLGVTSWSKTKRTALTVRYDKLIVIGDGDAAGKKMFMTVADSVRKHCDCKRIRLPDGEDPASLDAQQYKQLKKLIDRKLEEM